MRKTTQNKVATYARPIKLDLGNIICEKQMLEG
jgi:hypothetical protein